ncbi:MAG: hypothetical protein ACKO1N_08660 [Erythrobacter sp.]
MWYRIGTVVLPGLVAVTVGAMTLGSPGHSQVPAPIAAQAGQSTPAGSSCPAKFDLTKLVAICDYVYDRTRMPTGSTYRFEYERAINEAACTSPAEPIEIQREKIQRLWNNHQQSFRCTANNFDVNEGNVLKYAIKTRSFSLVNAAIARSELNLNYVDPSDGRTILDYVDEELRLNRGSTNEFQLQEFFNVMRSRGAKFAHEL